MFFPQTTESAAEQPTPGSSVMLGHDGAAGTHTTFSMRKIESRGESHVEGRATGLTQSAY